MLPLVGSLRAQPWQSKAQTGMMLPQYTWSKEVSAGQVTTVLDSFAEPVWVCVHVLSCLLQMLVVSLTQRYARAYKIHMQQSTSPIVRHPAPHGKPPTLMPRKQVLVFLTLMTTNQQCCDRLNKNCSEIIVWHLTPCWKIILMGSDHGKILFSPENIFA